MKLLVFDTETTGLPPKVPVLEETLNDWPNIVQLSWMTFDTETYKYTEYDYVITSPCEIKNDHIHGITTSMNKAIGFPFKPVYSIFKECLYTCDLVIGHNIRFDINMLHVECLRNGIVWTNNKPTYCTMMATTRMCKLNKWPRLSELHQHLFHEDAENLHNSMIDVIVCLRCYLKIMYGVDVCERVKKLRRF
jgi:DNA polymerase III epsilon subunit-like protein